MADARASFPPDVTCVLTSCGRWDLLTRTLDSFFLVHDVLGRLVVAEDSGDAAFAGRIAARYPRLEVIANERRLGQHGSIDKAYAAVTTRWIVHLEDDWLFREPFDLAAARAVMEDDATIIAVCFSDYRRLKLRHRIWGRSFVQSGHRYGDLRRAHRDWYGFSFNPSLIERRTWERHGPYAKFANERAISSHMKGEGLGIVHQLPGAAVHLGKGRSVFDPARADEDRRITRAKLWRGNPKPKIPG